MSSMQAGNTHFSVVFAERRDIGREWNDVKWNKDHSQIQYHRLYYVTKGSALLRLTDRDITLNAGNVYFIPAFSVAESHIDGEMNKFYIHFACNSRYFELYKYLCDNFSRPAGESCEMLFRTVVENYARPDEAARMRVQGAMSMIMADFTADIGSQSATLSRFEPVLDFVDAHFRESIPVSTLAELINVSPMYFSNLFKSTFNISPKQFVLNKRLTESQRLLLQTTMSVKEIAYAVGFENENYFSEFFASKVGISALKFRSRRLPTTKESIL